jgi:death-on-curing protein
VSGAIEYLDIDDLINLATDLLGDPPPIRDLGLLGSAAARPQASAFGEDAYPDLWTKAAALMQSIVKNHALVDGNKRLGWLATAVFLEINGVDVIHIENDAVYEFVIAVAAGHDDVSEIAGQLRSLVGGPPANHLENEGRD